MNDELDEFNSQPNTRTLVWDVRDLDDPIIVTEFLHTTTASDTTSMWWVTSCTSPTTRRDCGF